MEFPGVDITFPCIVQKNMNFFFLFLHDFWLILCRHASQSGLVHNLLLILFVLYFFTLFIIEMIVYIIFRKDAAANRKL